MLESGAATDCKNRRGGTPLHDFTFADTCTSKILGSFVRFNADINVRDGSGWTPLHWVTRSGNIGMIDAFVQQGANLEIESDIGATPLFFALSRHNHIAFERLLQSGADCTFRSHISSLLHFVARDGEIETIRYLAQNPARNIDPNERDIDGFTALDRAERRRDGIIEYTDMGADEVSQLSDPAASFEAFQSLIRNLDFHAAEATVRTSTTVPESFSNDAAGLRKSHPISMASTEAADVQDSDCDTFFDAVDSFDLSLS